MKKKRDRTKDRRPGASDSGSSFAHMQAWESKRVKEAEENKPLTAEEHRKIIEAENLESRENIKRLRQQHDEHMKVLKDSVN